MKKVFIPRGQIVSAILIAIIATSCAPIAPSVDKRRRLTSSQTGTQPKPTTKFKYQTRVVGSEVLGKETFFGTYELTDEELTKFEDEGSVELLVAGRPPRAAVVVVDLDPELITTKLGDYVTTFKKKRGFDNVRILAEEKPAGPAGIELNSLVRKNLDRVILVYTKKALEKLNDKTK